MLARTDKAGWLFFQVVALSLVFLAGPIPDDLLKHQRFKTKAFEPGVSLDGPALRVFNSKRKASKSVIVPILVGYADLITDLYTAVSYYQSGHLVWFWLALLLALGPGFIFAQLALPNIEWADRILIATNLSSLVEAGRTVETLRTSRTLALMRVIEPLLESVPELLLQVYVLLKLWNETPRLDLQIASVCISATSLALAATEIASVDSLVYQTRQSIGTFEGSSLCSLLPSLTGLVCGRVPATGASSLRGFGTITPRTHVVFCFVYHLLEIFCRFLPLAMLALVIRGWFFLVLPYLWISRGLVVLVAAWSSGGLAELAAAREALDYRFRVRLVGMPFLDSILDGTVAFGFGLVLTLVEFLLCLAIYHVFTDDALPTQVRETLTMVAGVCIFGKMVLAAIVIYPLKEVGGNVVADDAGGELADGSV